MLKKYFFLFCLTIASRVIIIQAAAPFVSPLAESINNPGGTLENARNTRTVAEKSVSSIALTRIRTAISALTIIQGGYDFGCLVKSHFSPSEAEQHHKETVIEQLNIIKAEEALYECLLKNADTAKDHAGLPCNCDETAKMFAMAAGPPALNDVTEEFNSVVKKCNFPVDQNVTISSATEEKHQGMSTTKKVLIGGAITIGVAGAAVIAAPIVFPGTIVAAKAAAITAAAKSAAAATVAKTVVISKTVVSNVAAMELMDTINTTALAVDGIRLTNFAIHHSRQFVYPTLDQELRQLLKKRKQRKSLAERILEYQKHAQISSE